MSTIAFFAFVTVARMNLGFWMASEQWELTAVQHHAASYNLNGQFMWNDSPIPVNEGTDQ